jgi:hypothetical protein
MNTLLLDIDGVLIRDKVLLDHVKHNIVKYVYKKVPSNNSPHKLNNLLYRAYGHTAVGLKKEYGVDTRDFDYRVYTPQVLDHLDDFLDTREFQNDAEIVRNILSMGWNVELFSNSPLVWSEPVKYAIDSTRIKNGGVYEKPKIDTYLKFDPFHKYVFVDDKVCNLLPTLFLDNWKQIHFGRGGGQFMDRVSSMEELFMKIQPLHDRPATLS